MAGKRGFKGGLRLLLVILALILTVPSLAEQALAQNPYVDLYVTIKDVNSGVLITSMPVSLEWHKEETGGIVRLTKYLDNRGTFSYRISPGRWKLKAIIDNVSTPEGDFMAEGVFTVSDNLVTMAETIYAVPIGSLQLDILDASGNLVSGADISLRCKSYSQDASTDRFGRFTAENIPVGQCRISAAYGNLVGDGTAMIMQGQEEVLRITLSKTLISSIEAYYYYALAVFVLIIIAAAAYFIISGRRMKKHVKEEVDKRIQKTEKKLMGKAARKEQKEKRLAADDAPSSEPQELNPRARDIMKTLNEKEKKIVDLLVSSSHKSTQANIRNETGIPKTSLARIFISLEAKNVIKVETIGKMKKIELTDWFLGKE